MNPSPFATQPWIRRSAFGFMAVGVGVLALTALHVPAVAALFSAAYVVYAKVAAFLLTAAGYFLTLQKYLHRRDVLLGTREEVSWRSSVLNNAPMAAVVSFAGKPVFLNATAQTWLGIGMVNSLATLADYIASSDAEKFTALVQKLETEKQTFVMDTRVRAGERPIRITSTLLPEGGAIIWLFDRNEEKDRETAWKRDRSVLEAEVAKLSVVTDALPRPVWLRRLNGQIVWCNTTFAHMMEATREDCVTKQIEFAPSTMVKAARDLAKTALEKGATQYEDRHVVVEGTRKLFRVYETPVIVEGYIVGLALDQTELEETQTELSRHMSAFEETLENLVVPIAIYDGEHKLRFYNQSYLRLWQIDEAFARSAPTYGDVMEDLRQRRKLPEVVDFQRFRREQQSRFSTLINTVDEMMHLPDGTTIRMLYIPHPLGGVMMVTEDVTDKLALESSYNTLIAVQQETLDNMSEGVMVLGGDGRVKLSNPALARIWNLDLDTMDVNPHISDVLTQMRPFLEYDGDWNTFHGEMTGRMLQRVAAQRRLTRADKSIVDTASVPLPDGNVLHIYLDVTDAARVEQALRTTNRALAAADKLKSEFVANVSYQLRTPLSTIIGFAEILTNQYFGELNERQMDYAKTILEASRKLLALINTVLDLATIEAGRMILNRRATDVEKLCKEAVAQVAGWAQRQQLDVTLNCPEGLQQPEIDERRVNQVLFNLLTNAVQYTPPGGHITLTVKQDDLNTIFIVTDTGIGMSEGEAERVFNKFERANPQARQPGVGLGLALVKSLIELHVGRVTLVSETNKGTTVTCVLPNKATQYVPDTRATQNDAA